MIQAAVPEIKDWRSEYNCSLDEMEEIRKIRELLRILHFNNIIAEDIYNNCMEELSKAMRELGRRVENMRSHIL